MRVGDVPEQQSARLQIRHQDFVGVLEEDAADDRKTRLEVPVPPDRVDDGQAVGAARRHVVGTERRRLVDEAGTVVGGDVVGEDDDVGVLERYEVERAPVTPTFELAPGAGGEHLGVVTEKLPTSASATTSVSAPDRATA